MKNMNYCFAKQNIINEKKISQESYVLFSSKIQIQQFNECNIIYMDWTFKSSPKNYYQIYNILGRDNKTGEAYLYFIY